MIYSCNKCLKTFEKDVKKCPLCGGEVKKTLNKEYKKEARMDYKCPHCNHSYPLNFNICPSCGKRSERCPNCGYNFSTKLRICPSCGKKYKINS